MKTILSVTAIVKNALNAQKNNNSLRDHLSYTIYEGCFFAVQKKKANFFQKILLDFYVYPFYIYVFGSRL